MTLRLSPNAARVAEGIDPLEDVFRIRAGLADRASLLAECLDGVDDDATAVAWHDYVDEIVAEAACRRLTRAEDERRLRTHISMNHANRIVDQECDALGLAEDSGCRPSVNSDWRLGDGYTDEPAHLENVRALRAQVRRWAKEVLP